MSEEWVNYNACPNCGDEAEGVLHIVPTQMDGVFHICCSVCGFYVGAGMYASQERCDEITDDIICWECGARRGPKRMFWVDNNQWICKVCMSKNTEAEITTPEMTE